MKAKSIHPFPARMAPEIALRALKDLRQQVDGGIVPRVLDPMCGSGTVLTTAKTYGCQAIGRDVDPLAVLITRVAVMGNDSFDFSIVNQAACSAVEQAEAADSDEYPWTDPETIEFSKYWFGDDQRAQLCRLSLQIARLEDGPTKDILNLSLSRLIDTKSPRASLASDTSHSRPHKTIENSEYDVYKGFAKAVNIVLKYLANNRWTSDADVKEGDARLLDINSSSIDAVITSPPYLNAIDYMRGHKLSLIWMGYTIPQLRAIRSESVGSNRKPSGVTKQSVKEMVQCVREAANNADTLPMGVIERYADDMCAIAGEIHRVMKEGATAVLVVGNSTIRGNYIENDRLTRFACEQVGLTLTDRVEREIPESSRYLPLHGEALGKRMRAEVVLTFEKR